MKICRDHPVTSSKHTREEEREEVKQTETSSKKSYRDNLTTYITTEPTAPFRHAIPFFNFEGT